jgi:hypothetical protein
MSAAIRFLAAALLAAGCTFDPSGTIAESGDDVTGSADAIDAMRASSEEDPVADDGGMSVDGGVSGDAEVPVDAIEPAPDAKPEEDDCGGFGEACCEEGDACGGLLFCVGGTCV